MAKPEFKTARWIYSVSDPKTGEVLLANRPDELVFTASTAKNFTVGSVYAAVGPDATLTTPVYATAAPVDGVVDGDLVLVASGDLALGGRGAMEGRFDHTFTATTIDHVYGDVAPNATLVPDDPLAGLDDLARQVKAAGITIGRPRRHHRYPDLEHLRRPGGPSAVDLRQRQHPRHHGDGRGRR